jgi:hypothetical protein
MASKYKKGALIKDMNELVDAVFSDEWVIWHGKPLSPKFVKNMGILTVHQGIKYGSIHRAIKVTPT